MATIFKKEDLLYFVSQAVFECGWNIIYLNNEHPFRIKIFNDTESHLVKLSIYNISHGGGEKRATNEYRIQIKESTIVQEKDYKTLILGYFDKLQIFVGWDALKHQTPKYSSSLQIREEKLEQAAICGFSPCDKGNGETAIAFRPDFLVEYVRNLEVLHTFGQFIEDFAILEEVTRTEVVPNKEIIQQVSVPRQEVLQTISKKQRDNNFRARILRAYNYRCAFSGIQLKLVEAAHIVPVSFNSSIDETSNGIALSALHHKAYDKGLITFSEQYKIIFNENEIHKLKELNLHGGLDKFLSCLRPIIDVPPAVSDRPNVTYVKTANELRGW